MRTIHHRMPAILPTELCSAWLDQDNQDTVRLTKLLEELLVTDLVGAAVSSQVNAAGHDEPSNITPMEQMNFDF